MKFSYVRKNIIILVTLYNIIIMAEPKLNGPWGFKDTDNSDSELHNRKKKQLKISDNIQVQKTKKLKDTQIHVNCDLLKGIQIFGLIIVLIIFVFLITIAFISDKNWDTLNQDTLSTTFSNLIISPKKNGNLFSNTEQNQLQYVKYEDYTEVIASSLDFSFPKESYIIVDKPKNTNNNYTRDKISLLESERGESNYISNYHEHLSKEPNIPSEYLNLASINTISKIQHPINDSIYTYGKLSIATYNGKENSMLETITCDSMSIHLRSPDVFINKNLLVGDSLFFGLNEEDNDIYLPLLGLSDRLHPVEYNNMVQRGNLLDYVFYIGNADVDHVNVIAENSIVFGTYQRTGNSKKSTADDQYKLSMVIGQNNTHFSSAITTYNPISKLYTSSSEVLKVTNDKWYMNQTEHALESIRKLPVHQILMGNNDRKTMLLSDDVKNVFPDAITKDSFNIPNIKVKNTRNNKPSDFIIDLQSKEIESVDTDTIISYLVLAIQEQSKQIDYLKSKIINN